MAWAIPLYPRDKVNEAARVLLQIDKEVDSAPTAHDRALEVVNNWRACHSYPLNTFQMNLRSASRKVDAKSLIAQRIKRMSSVQHKLERFPKMKLSQMQDIGGCRAVLRSCRQVFRVLDAYENSRIKHQLINLDNYIDSPKMSGYRGIHLIYRYQSSGESKSCYNGLKIEVQLRSSYQHAWATAVETVGTFVQQALKSSLGEEQWLRFFALMGTAVAVREDCAPVPNTYSNNKELVEEIRELESFLDVKSRLWGYNSALQALDEKDIKNSHYYLLFLDASGTTLSISPYRKDEIEMASAAYMEAEKDVEKNSLLDAVLVSVDSLTSLRKAYPNYFADTSVFMRLLDNTLKGHF